MEIVRKGEVVIKWLNKMIGCTRCNGYFRLTEQDQPHEFTPTDKGYNWFTHTLCRQGTWYKVRCPTDGCGDLIEFVVS